MEHSFSEGRSSAIAHVSYDETTQRLSVTFRNGKHLYDFDGVPPSVVEGFIHDTSPGTFYRKNIQGNYPIQEV